MLNYSGPTPCPGGDCTDDDMPTICGSIECGGICCGCSTEGNPVCVNVTDPDDCSLFLAESTFYENVFECWGPCAPTCTTTGGGGSTTTAGEGSTTTAGEGSTTTTTSSTTTTTSSTTTTTTAPPPPGTGACAGCDLFGQYCFADVDESFCTSSGGVWQGPGSDCSAPEEWPPCEEP
jgi:hypothetical protein